MTLALKMAEVTSRLNLSFISSFVVSCRGLRLCKARLVLRQLLFFGRLAARCGSSQARPPAPVRHRGPHPGPHVSAASFCQQKTMLACDLSLAELQAT